MQFPNEALTESASAPPNRNYFTATYEGLRNARAGNKMSPARAWWALPKARYRDPHRLWNAKQHRYVMLCRLTKQ